MTVCFKNNDIHHAVIGIKNDYPKKEFSRGFEKT